MEMDEVPHFGTSPIQYILFYSSSFKKSWSDYTLLSYYARQIAMILSIAMCVYFPPFSRVSTLSAQAFTFPLKTSGPPAVDVYNFVEMVFHYKRLHFAPQGISHLSDFGPAQ